MKKVFINFTSYDGNEWVVIHHVGTDMTDSVQEFKKNLKDYLSIGPDDCHSFNLIKVNLKNKDYDRLMTITLQNDLDEDDLEFFTELENTYDFDYICYDDHSGNYEIVKLYCEDNNLDSEDDDVFEDVFELLMNDEKLYETYIDKYLDLNF
jgi:hypothetical protein